MDPLSITTGSFALAKVALQVAVVLHSGIAAIRGVDTTLQAFHGEVTALVNALNLVGGAFQDPKLKSLDKESLRSDSRLSQVFEGF